MSSQRGREGMVWKGNLQTTDLIAKRGAQPITWKQPIQVTLLAQEGPRGLVVQDLQCTSDFLNVYASGTPDQFTARADFNLNRLADQSGGVIDLGGIRLRGSGGASIAWLRSDGQTFNMDVSFRANRFQLTVPNRLTWNEDYVVGTLTATGLTDFTSQSRLATAVLDLELGPDTLNVKLLQPDADFRRGRVWPLEVTGKGQLARWQPRLSPWLDLSRWKLAGSYDVASKVAVSSEAIALRGARLSLADLVLLSPEANLREKQAQLTLTGQWNWVDKRLDLDSAVLAGSSWKAQADRFVLATPSRGPLELSGSIQGEIGLDRLQQWTTAGQPDPGAWRLGGKLSGRADFQRLGGTVSAAFDATLAEFQAVHPSGQRYQEAKIVASGRASYSDLNRWLLIERLSVASSALNSSATGKIAAAGGQTSLQLNGDVQYDLERVSELLRARYGENIRLRGRGLAPVAYQGILGSDQASATASLNWESADLYGFQIGPGELLAAFSEGIVHFKPMELHVNDGRLKLGPRVRVNPPPAALGFEPGRVVERVSITPAMCASLLQYVAPVLAGVAQAQGSFSIDLEGCEMPLANLGASDIAGKLLIHSVQVGPGPLLQELALVLGRATPAEIARDSAIPFRMVGGRVYHRDLELLFGDVKLRTYGSVGMDQTLAMMVVVPTPPSWLANPALAPALKNQKTIEVPVGGTLRQPRIDRVALEQISRQFLQNAVQNAARSAIEDQINRGLNRMLPQQPAPKPKR